jgi:putative DNA primase/helicase
VTRGPKRGLWYDHETGEGHDLLDWIRRERQCSFLAAIKWARSFLGMPEPAGRELTAGELAQREADQQERTRQRAAEEAAWQAEQEADEKRRIEEAGEIWARTKPVRGTLAERYLVQTRCIPAPPRWPWCPAFDPTNPALTCLVTAHDGELVGVQHVFLDKHAQKDPRGQCGTAKQSNGVPSRGCLRLPGPADGPLLLCEGPETGLSAWVATGHETWITVGQIGNINPPAGRRVVICRDDDKEPKNGDRRKSPNRIVRELVQQWAPVCESVAVATPWPVRRYDKSDLNDTLKVGGIEAVRARIAAAQQPFPSRPKRLPVDDARELVRADIRAAARKLMAYDPDDTATAGQPPPVRAIRVHCGVGKSNAAMAEIARVVR